MLRKKYCDDRLFTCINNVHQQPSVVENTIFCSTGIFESAKCSQVSEFCPNIVGPIWISEAGNYFNLMILVHNIKFSFSNLNTYPFEMSTSN